MGKPSVEAGRHYEVAWQDGIGLGPLDAYLAMEAGTKIACEGRWTASTLVNINKPDLWGGEKDQGGVVGGLRLMFGEEGQLPNAYLTETFGTQTAAWSGVATVAFEGGRWGANNPQERDRAHKVERILKGWDDDACWYPAKAPVPLDGGGSGFDGPSLLVTGSALESGGPVWAHAPAVNNPQFVGIDISTGADIQGGSPRCNGSVWVVASMDDHQARVSVNSHASWSSVSTDVICTGNLACGPGGWLMCGRDGSDVFDRVAIANVVPAGFSSYRFAAENPPGTTLFPHGEETYSIAFTGNDYFFDVGARGYFVWGAAFGSIQQCTYARAGASPLTAAFDSVDFGGKRLVVGETGLYSGNGQLASIATGTIDEVLISRPYGQPRLLQIETGNDIAIVYCDGGDYCYTSADGYAAPHATGLDYTGGINARRLTFSNNLFFIIGTVGGIPCIVTTPDGLTYSDPDFSIPLASVVGIASGGVADQVFGQYAENPVHSILYAHTQAHAGAQPLESINLASATAAADWYYAQGFGLCSTRIPSKESPNEYIERIERVAGCSFTQSNEDGLYYFDIANGEYDLDSLPILTDDDIIDFEEVAVTLDSAINSVSVKYFDPERNETITTRPLQAIGLIADFGENHQAYDFPEIPTGGIAGRVQMREALATTTPTRSFNLVTTPKTRSWRESTYFRLQSNKRGIADMVCLVAEGDDGSLKSGNCKLTATQDIYSLPTTVYSGIEHGVDTRPPQTPIANTAERVFEAPYMEAVAAIPSSDFAALAPDAGFAVAVAANPGEMLDFTMSVDAGAGYQDKATGDYCPTALLAAELLPGTKTGIAYTDGVRMSRIAIGSMVLLNDELCRVDAVDTTAHTFDLGRACADTVPGKHAAGSRLYFYTDQDAADRTEYTDGETIAIKLRSNTGSQRLDLADATALPLTFARRIDRPLPPRGLTINDLPFYESAAIAPGGGTGTGGGGGGGPGSPTPPPTTTPDGSTGSTTLGPYGGYADDGEPALPLPTVFDTDIVGTDGQFDGVDPLADWLTPQGDPLGPEWSVVDGGLQYRSANAGAAYAVYWPARKRLPALAFPRFTMTTGADITTDGGALAAVDAAAAQIADMLEYPVTTTVSTVKSVARERPGLTGSGLLVTPEAAPMLSVYNPGHGWVSARFDNVTFEVAEDAYTTTAVVPANIDFPADDLTGWITFAGGKAVTISGGELTAETISEFGTVQWFINTDPIITPEADRMIRISGKVTCNDPTTKTGAGGIVVPTGGVAFGLAIYYAGIWNYVGYTYAFQRGDRTLREQWQRGGSIDTTGATYHVMFATKSELGYVSKVRDITVEYVNEDVPEAP